MRILALIPFLFLLIKPGSSQIDVRASLDTNVIRIGEQPRLTLSVSYPVEQKDVRIEWPIIGDSISNKVEVIHIGNVDSSYQGEKEGKEIFEQTRDIRITSFDSGYHPIPPFEFVVNDDTLRTNVELLEVRSVEVDTSLNSIKDIHEIYKFPFRLSAWLKDNWGWIAGGAGLIALAALLWWYIKRIREKRRTAEPEEPRVPPHEVALEELHGMKNAPPWRSESVKSFYIRLSEVIRNYLEGRYRIPALEETTAQIMNDLQLTDIQEDEKGRLRKVLKLSDLVKFAKREPSSSENERILDEAIAFVERTKIVEDHGSSQPGEGT